MEGFARMVRFAAWRAVPAQFATRHGGLCPHGSLRGMEGFARTVRFAAQMGWCGLKASFFTAKSQRNAENLLCELCAFAVKKRKVKK
jgi:hypothetical protein